MSRSAKVQEAREILKALGFPREEPGERACLVLAALASVKPADRWQAATNQMRTLKYGIAQFIYPYYRDEPYAENTRESIREDLANLVSMGAVVENVDMPNRPRTSKDFNYSLTWEALAVITSFGTANWDSYVISFHEKAGSLRRYKYQQARRVHFSFMPNWGLNIQLVSDDHGALMIDFADAVKEFHFPDAEILFIDHALPTAYVNNIRFADLRLVYDPSNKLPDLILHVPSLGLLLVVEAVWSGGEVNKARRDYLESIFHQCTCPRIYASAFKNFKTFKGKYAHTVAWGSLVWISEWPDHLIHYNGETIRKALSRE